MNGKKEILFLCMYQQNKNTRREMSKNKRPRQDRTFFIPGSQGTDLFKDCVEGKKNEAYPMSQVSIDHR